jgi:hypothetical protein
MHESHFWLCMNMILASVIVVLILTISSCTQKTHQKKVDMVKAGATPAEAWCLLEASSDSGEEMLLCREVFMEKADADVPL